MNARVERKKKTEHLGLAIVASREQLLNAASALMVERGSTDVSLSEIAQKSGLNAALVKYYFGSKSALMMALLRRALGPGMEQLEHLIEMPLAPQDKLRIHINGMVNNYFLHPYVNRLMHQLADESGTEYDRLIADEFGKPTAKAQARILGEGIEAGCFRQVDPMLFYFHIIGACDQLFYGRYLLRNIFGVHKIEEPLKRQYVDYLVESVLNGVLLTTGENVS